MSLRLWIILLILALLLLFAWFASKVIEGADSDEDYMYINKLVDVDYYGQGTFYPGWITSINANDTFDITYQNGIVEQNVKKKNMRSYSDNASSYVEVGTGTLDTASTTKLPKNMVLDTQGSITVGGGQPMVTTTTSQSVNQEQNTRPSDSTTTTAPIQDPTACNWETCGPFLRDWRQTNVASYPDDWWMKNGQPGGCANCPGKGTRNPLPFSEWTPFKNNNFSSITDLKLLGNYFETCTNAKIEGNILSATCRGVEGGQGQSTLDLSGCKSTDNVSNKNSILQCGYV
jgi:hypothetical protein